MLERTCKHEKHNPNGVRGESVVCKGSVLPDQLATLEDGKLCDPKENLTNR